MTWAEQATAINAAIAADDAATAGCPGVVEDSKNALVKSGASSRRQSLQAEIAEVLATYRPPPLRPDWAVCP
jgi:hypothetical protein